MTKKLRRILRSFKMTRFRVDFPAQKDARVVILKRDSSREETADARQKNGVREWLISRK